MGLARYLPEFGWQAVILTAALPGRPDPKFEVVETPRRDSAVLRLGRRLFGLNTEQPLMAQTAQLKNKLRIRSERSPLDVLLTAVGEVTAYPDPQKGWRRFAIEAGGNILRSRAMERPGVNLVSRAPSGPSFSSLKKT